MIRTLTPPIKSLPCITTWASCRHALINPQDKAKVEVGVQVVERWILTALRHQKFFRLADLNNAIRELLERLNQRPFRKREGSRASVFAAVERNALRALPAEPFDMSQWSLRPSQHRLPHRLRRQLLQCVLFAGARTRGSSSDTDDHRDLSQRTAGSLASSVVMDENRCSRRENTGRRVTKHIWSGRPHGW